ncbi:MAG TPA: head GIN domain-containing protein, partial [Prolixibacteraceae bacterium]|nr:head GIN domain-containing protein [Prolixibacteraceae bacterium]
DGILIDGNNEVTEEIRSLPDFSGVSSSGSFNVIYTYGKDPGVTIECESNLLPYIETAVFNNRLEIQTASHVSIFSHKSINVYVSSPAIQLIELSGSGSIVADSVSETSFEIYLSGSGNIQSNFYGNNFKSGTSGSGSMNIVAHCQTVETDISGSGHLNLEAYQCNDVDITISGSGEAYLEGSSKKASFKTIGSGEISAYKFPVKEADVTISGSGDVYVTVSDYLDALLSGSGNLYYKGSPKVNSNTSGSGRIIPED